MSNAAFYGGLFGEARDDALQGVGVQTTAGDVFRAGVVAALDHQDVGAGARQHQGGDAAGQTCADDNGVKCIFRHGVSSSR